MTIRLLALLRRHWLSLMAILAITLGGACLWHRLPQPEAERPVATSNLSRLGYRNLHNGVTLSGVAPVNTIHTALRYLSLYPWKGHSDNLLQDVEHRLHGIFQVPGRVAGQHGLLLVYATNGEYQDCHACAPWLSFLEFQPKGNDWVLDRRSVLNSQLGQWGEVPSMHVTPVAPGHYAVFIELGFTAQGWTDSGVAVLAWRDNTMVETLFLHTGDSDGGDPERSWGSHVNLQPSANGQFDLVVERFPGPNRGDKEFMLRPDGPQTAWLDSAGQPQLRQVYRWTGYSFESL